ncbi:hypothetical protein ABZY20_01520 [Streptomyces sp. NPDC006624]|uniref:hypothetical protein n=1 Tax=Streptomyces sp. NPDC006624 TaxID=3154892 RepID=UPI0033B01BD9
MNTERPDHDDDSREAGAAGTADAPEAGASGTASAEASSSAGARASTSAETEGSTGAAEPGEAGEPQDAAEADEPQDATEAGETREAGEAGEPEQRAEPERATEPEKAAEPAAGAAEPGAGAAGAEQGAGAAGAEQGAASAAAEQAEEAGAEAGGGKEGPAGPAPRPGLRDDEDPARHPGRSRTPAIIASVAAAVLLIGGGGAWLASHASGGSGEDTTSGAPGGDGTPPPLALDGYSDSTGEDGNGIAPGEPNPYGATYRVGGPLPTGPRDAPVYRAQGEVGKDDVARLAKALGVEGTPVAQGEVWKIGGQDGSGPALQVNKQAPGAWSFSRYAPGTDDCKGVDTCDKAPRTGGETVSEEEAEKAAAPVLEALGQDDAKVDARQVMGAQRVVNAAPVVGGLPTYGWTTGVTVGSDGEVVGGSGQLRTPVEGDTYPVVTVQKALELMNGQPKSDGRVGIGGCTGPVPLEGEDRPEQPCESPASGAPQRDTVTVESAVFGLAAHVVDGRQALVPSWLFEVTAPGAKEPFTVTYPAVDPKFLASPEPGGPGDEPTSKPQPREVQVEGYRAEGAELTVTFTGGVCADYDVRATEKGDEVTVTVTSTPWPDKVCIMIAKKFEKTVRLDEPLGDRRVVGADGKAVPLAKEGARLPAPPTRER